MERIFVTVRAKPLSPDDAKASPWRISDNSISLVNQPSKFEFDRVFGGDCMTREVYEARTKEIVASAVHGFNGTVFAYGQTSSGKTYTMRGSAQEPGIILLAVDDLFQSIQQDIDREFLVRVSYMEIYNEEINDLLVPEHRKLQIHESIERGIFVAGLKEEIVTCPEQVLDLMEFGESHRHVGETNMNLYSSRSHTIFRMIIESRERSDDGGDCDSCDAIRVSVLNLVDLAGSERVVKTGAEGVRLKEGSHINKSLLTLGTVIKKLSEGVESQGGHVPFRDSKLTRILQPALGGNANTAIICNITLAQIHTDETKSTLQFASRALRVTNCAHVNEILTDAALLKRQKKEIEDLRARLQGSHSEHWEEEILNLRNTLLQSELEKERIALELEEEKKDKAQREKRLQEKIANLSSMVLYSKRDGDSSSNQTGRRNTWCPGPSLDKPGNDDFSRGSLMVGESLGAEKSEIDVRLQPSFEDLMEENIGEDTHNLECLQFQNNRESISSQDDFCFFDKHAFMHVTSRRKAHRRNTSSPVRAKMDTLFQADEKQFENSSIIMGNSSALNQTRLLEMEKVSDRGDSDTASKDIQAVWEFLGVESELHQTKETICSISCIFEGLIQDYFVLSKTFMEMKASASRDVQQLKFVIHGHDQVYNCILKKANELEKEKCLLLEKSVGDDKKIEELKFELDSCKETLNGKLSEYDLEKDELFHQILNLQKEVTCLSSSSLVREKEGLRKDLEKTRAKLKETESKFRNAVQEKIKLEGEKAHNEREIKHLVSQRALLERNISRRESLIEKKNEVRTSDLNRTKGQVGPSDHILQIECQRLELHVFELESEIASLKEKYLAVIKERDEAFIRPCSLDAELEATVERLNATSSALENLQEEVAATNLRSHQYESHCEELEHSIETISKEKEEMGVQLTDALLELEAEKSIRSCVEKNFAEINGKMKLCEEKDAVLTKDLVQARQELEFYNQECQILRKKVVLSEEQAEYDRQLSVSMSVEIAKLRTDMAQIQTHSAKCEEEFKAKYETLLSDACMLRAEMDDLSRERDMLAFQLEEKNAARDPSELENLLENMMESDNLLEKNAESEAIRNTHANIAEVDGIAKKISPMEAQVCYRPPSRNQQAVDWSKMQLRTTDASSNKENLKLRMRLRSTQAKLNMHRGRYKEVLGDMSLMHKKYDEASAKLKDQLAMYGMEILHLKKELSTGS